MKHNNASVHTLICFFLSRSSSTRTGTQMHSSRSCGEASRMCWRRQCVPGWQHCLEADVLPLELLVQELLPLVEVGWEVWHPLPAESNSWTSS